MPEKSHNLSHVEGPSKIAIANYIMQHRNVRAVTLVEHGVSFDADTFEIREARLRQHIDRTIAEFALFRNIQKEISGTARHHRVGPVPFASSSDDSSRWNSSIADFARSP